MAEEGIWRKGCDGEIKSRDDGFTSEFDSTTYRMLLLVYKFTIRGEQHVSKH